MIFNKSAILTISQMKYRDDKEEIMGKLIFLDIDGTLMDYSGHIPESAENALKKAKINGHKIFICSGRTRKEFYASLDNYQLDGFVASTGAHVNYQGKDIYCHYMDKENVAKAVRIFEEFHIGFKLQTSSGSYTSQEGLDKLIEMFSGISGYNKEWIDSIADNMYVMQSIIEIENIEKILYLNAPFTVDEMQHKLNSEYFTVMMASIEEMNPFSGEITEAGTNKSSGIQKILNHLNMTRNDCIAIGDGPNDMDMIIFAGIGVAMGNATDDIKAKADLVTESVNEDGIYKAFIKLGLI